MALDLFNESEHWKLDRIKNSKVLSTGYGIVISNGESVYFINKDSMANRFSRGNMYVVTDEAIEQFKKEYPNCQNFDQIIGSFGTSAALTAILVDLGCWIDDDSKLRIIHELGLEWDWKQSSDVGAYLKDKK
ncbi:MAG: hypothetical protein JW791_03315 [Nanoarchaeota archaeon]|nr:hypothetical protein [Nanoarchaeota archaeon]